jgi:hypothetical protein
MRGGLQPRPAERCRLVADPAVAVRRLRRRHLQPCRSRAPRGPGGGDRSADRRPARPQANRVTSCAPEEGHTRAATWPYRAERRDPFMTHAAENRGHEGVSTGLLRLLRNFSRRSNRLVDLRFCVERVTGIEPAWPAWKAMTPVYRPSPPQHVRQDEQGAPRPPGPGGG